MKIAILYIATGRYNIFWRDFYESSERYFIPNRDKEYYVFTDATSIYAQDKPNVHKIPHQKLGWPYDTLLRFETFLKVEGHLMNTDYIFFFNANMKFVALVTADEFLPNSESDNGLAALHHPGYYNKELGQFPYERELMQSKAYVPVNSGKYYFMGALNGGKTKTYMQLVKTLKANIQDDIDKGIIAVWHDESHLNHYLIDYPPKILSPSYGYPEERGIPFTPKIIIQDKRKFGGHNFLRKSGKITPVQWIISRFVVIFYYVTTYLKRILQ